MQLSVGPGESTSHQAGICLLSPGLYQIALQHVQCRPAQPQDSQQQPGQQQCNAIALVEPCYVLALASGTDGEQH